MRKKDGSENEYGLQIQSDWHFVVMAVAEMQD
jgi:hypothetical protein